MGRWWKRVDRFLKDTDGPTAVEYAVMLGLLIMVCFIAVTALGTTTSKTFNQPALGSSMGS